MSLDNESNRICYFLGHSHLDAGWLWTFSESIEIFHDTCETILRLMKEYPDFYFCQSSAQYYKWLEEKYPQTFEKVKERIDEGRWEVVGGTWVEPDCNLPSGESLVRQFLYGKQYFKRKFGVDVRIAWMPDSFGFPWSLPQIMSKSGIEFFLTQKMNWNDTTQFPYHIFRWTASDGSSLLAHQSVGSYHDQVEEQEIDRQMARLQSRDHFSNLLVLFGIGDHAGGVTEDMIMRASEFVQGKKKTKGVFSSAQGYFDAVLRKAATQILPEINDEVYLQFHRGTYTTQGKVKRNNRKAECLLENAEKFSALATSYDYPYPSQRLKEAWENLMLNQFHDVLPGTSLSPIYEDSQACFNSIFNIGETILSESLNIIAANIETNTEGKSIVVFNSLSWPRTGLVEVPLQGFGEGFEILDEGGQVVPSDILEKGQTRIFIAKNVPSIGYKEYKAKRAGQARKRRPSLSCMESSEGIKLENEFLAIEISKKTGLVTSLFDKKNKVETLRGEGNRIRVFDDTPVEGRRCLNSPTDASIFDSWELYIHDQSGGPKCIELREPVDVKLVEAGSVRATVRVKYKYVQEGRPESSFDQEIVLHDADPVVKFNLHVNWHASHRLAKVIFPLHAHNDATSYEIPYGHITRRDPTSSKATPEEKAKYEAPGQKWVDHTDSNGEYGVSLLNDCKYGFNVANDTIGMTLLRSARYATELRMTFFGLPYDEKTTTMMADQGEHDMSYALYPHRSDFRTAHTARRAYEFNYPLLHVEETNHSGTLPPTHSFISIEPDNLILTVIKKSEDSDDLVLRCYETFAEDSKAVIRVAQHFEEARETNLLEDEISKLKTYDNRIELPIGKDEIKTIKLTMR